MKTIGLVMLVPALLVGCGSSDSGAPAETPGAAGSSGSSGSNSGGSSGSNSGGSSGSNSGGSGGSGGSSGGSSGGGSAGSAGAGGISPPTVPDALKVPDAMDVVVLKAHGVGVQIYTCTDTGAAGAGGGGGGGGGSGGSSGSGGAAGGPQFQWIFKEPKADLFDDAMTKIGLHYAGPTWESTDGSKLVGAKVAQAPSPTPGNIPWLLLAAKSTSGTGVLTKVAFIQRVDTKGGVAPADGCDAAHVSTESQIAYEANYYFFAAP